MQKHVLICILLPTVQKHCNCRYPCNCSRINYPMAPLPVSGMPRYNQTHNASPYIQIDDLVLQDVQQQQHQQHHDTGHVTPHLNHMTSLYHAHSAIVPNHVPLAGHNGYRATYTPAPLSYTSAGSSNSSTPSPPILVQDTRHTDLEAGFKAACAEFTSGFHGGDSEDELATPLIPEDTPRIQEKLTILPKSTTLMPSLLDLSPPTILSVDDELTYDTLPACMFSCPVQSPQMTSLMEARACLDRSDSITSSTSSSSSSTTSSAGTPTTDTPTEFLIGDFNSCLDVDDDLSLNLPSITAFLEEEDISSVRDVDEWSLGGDDSCAIIINESLTTSPVSSAEDCSYSALLQASDIDTSRLKPRFSDVDFRELIPNFS